MGNSRTMLWLHGEAKKRGMKLREIGRRLGHANATRVGEYFSLKIVPGADMVRRLALAIGVPPIEALWEAEHQSAVFDDFELLYNLGWSWMKADRVSLDEGGANFLKCYVKPDGSIEGQPDLSAVPATLAHRYHQGEILNIYTGGKHRSYVSVAKPIAVAILLAVGLFPRRGDKLRPETKQLVADLSRVAAEMIPLAERATGPERLKTPSRPLDEAQRILRWRFYGPRRLAIAAEFVHAWCDFSCFEYAQYARLALYSQGGFIGAPGEIEDIWSYESAAVPSADDLKI